MMGQKVIPERDTGSSSDPDLSTFAFKIGKPDASIEAADYFSPAFMGKLKGNKGQKDFRQMRRRMAKEILRIRRGSSMGV